jgi:hypothetical protein
MPGYLNDALPIRMSVDIMVRPIAPFAPSVFFSDTSHFTPFHSPRTTAQIYNINAIYPTVFLFKDTRTDPQEKTRMRDLQNLEKTEES